MKALGLELDSEHDHTGKKANSKSQKEAVEVGTNKQKLKPKEKIKEQNFIFDGDHCAMCKDVLLLEVGHTSDLIDLHNQLVFTDSYNFECLKIPIYSKLNIRFWRFQLEFYFDKVICEFLEFGWPIGIKYLESLDVVEKKCRIHTGARFYPKDIEKYIKKEKTYCAVLGLFKVNPFSDKLVISPLNSVPRSGSAKRRVIMDLSHPKCHSVNDCIENNEYLGDRVDLHYPNVDKLVDIIKSKGQNCLI
ncbi:unnamed protein product [Mytilus coruscus]|uniref:Uncharacterized protein n=1 Tax=Mytilus coruscus TaxID=42192 RepID=A0A6J8CYL8_MYTCO|nr:unnamed protein product [Mytilus coruscus]